MATMSPVGGMPPAPSGTNAPASAFPPVVTAPDPAAVGAPTIETRMPTMGTGQSIALPMTGPSRRTMTIAASGIAVAGIAIGALVAMRALRPRPEAPPLPPSDTTVALVETPHVIGQADGGATGNAAPNTGSGDSRGARVRPRTGTGTGTAAPSTAGNAAGTNSAPSGGVTGQHTGVVSGTGTHAAATDTTPPTTAHGHTEAPPNTEPAGSGETGTPAGGTAPTAAELAQLANTAGTSGSGIAPRGPTVGGYIQGEETDATGTMDPTVFSYVYRHYRPQIAACQSMVTRATPVAGTMRVRVRLGVDGHVSRTTVLSNTTNNAELATCVTTSIHSWAYPRPDGGEVEFDYNFGFGS